ncbi:MAG: acyl-CoA/acyl-ACP dehydrogenase [bacterium]|nr:acyl-CoA/acyl-ACP dehydrogenase [bacterium]
MDFTLTPLQKELVERATAAGQEYRKFGNEWDQANLAPIEEVTVRMAELGLTGITMPKEYGGLGLSTLEYALIVEAVVRASASWVPGEPMFRTSGPGVSMILMSANEVVREKYLRDVVAGKAGVAISITEPDYGSDMSSIQTTAVPDGNDYIISGEKKYITGAIEDKLYATFVRFDGIPGPRGVGAILVERDTPGLEMQRGPMFVGSRGVPHGEIQYNDVRVTKDNLLIGPGEFPRLMKAFNMERLHNGSSSLGSAAAAFDEVLEYTQQRHQFGRPIADFQAVYHDLADMWTSIEGARYLVYKAAATSEDGKYPNPMEVTVAKYVANNVMYDVTARSVILQGGHGTESDGVSVSQRLHRDSLVCKVAGGSPQVIRNVIAQQLMPDRKFPQRA